MPETRSTSRRRAAAAAVVTLLLGLTAGCASTSASSGASTSAASSATHPTSSLRPAAAAPSSPVAGYDTAAALARQITGCNPHVLSPHTAANRLHLPGTRAIVSTASCTLRGRTAIVLTFTSRGDQAAINTELSGRVAYYATGTGWSAAPTDTSERVGQQSVVQDVALALGGLVETGGA